MDRPIPTRLDQARFVTNRLLDKIDAYQIFFGSELEERDSRKTNGISPNHNCSDNCTHVKSNLLGIDFEKTDTD